MSTWIVVVVVIASSLWCGYADFRWKKLLAEVIEKERKKSLEIERLRGIIWKHEDTIIDHKEQIAELEETIEALRAEREKHAKRILSLEDSYRDKCREMKALDREIIAGRDTRADALRLRGTLNQFIQGMDESLDKYLFATLKPTQLEDQQQKPTCDN